MIQDDPGRLCGVVHGYVAVSPAQEQLVPAGAVMVRGEPLWGMDCG